MPQDPALYLIMAGGMLAMVALLAFAGLRGWREWIAFKREEISLHRGQTEPVMVNTASRIDVADLKERVRKLEAIAAGIDL